MSNAPYDGLLYEQKLHICKRVYMDPRTRARVSKGEGIGPHLRYTLVALARTRKEWPNAFVRARAFSMH